VRLGRFRIERLRWPGVTSLSVWNRPLPDGRELWQQVGAPWVEEQRRRGVHEATIGQGLAEVLAPAIRGLHQELGLAACFLTGGLCAIAGFREALHVAVGSFPITIAHDPVWAAAEAGLAWLREQGTPESGVVDVGQTAIKTLSRAGRHVHERDLEALPFRLIGEDGTSRGAPTERLATFLSTALAALEVPSPAQDPRVLLALPCPIEDDLLPGPCTYGWQGDRGLLPAVFLSPAGPWPDREVRVDVLNDAELAAEAARRSFVLEPGSRVLCLTLGFGPGGALLGV
jgi:hypothetical protein